MTAETSNAREWVLVPREPSAGMWDAAERAMIESECAYNAGDPAARSDAHGFPTMRIWQAVVGYRAMLAAAPPPAAARGDVRGLVAKCRAEADAAYVAYIQKMDTDECRGWEAKVRAGTFARANLDAFTAAAELLGRHRALHAFANRFEAALAADGVQAGEVSAYDLAVLDDAAETLDRIGEGSAGLREARARIASALSQQPEAQCGGEVVAWRILWSPQFPETAELTSDGERVQKVRALDNSPQIEPLYTAPPSAPVGVELSALRVQEWLHREHDILCPVQEIEQAMRTPCSCPFTERALAQQPAAVDEAMVERAWVAFCENNGSARQGIRAALTAALATQPGGAE